MPEHTIAENLQRLVNAKENIGKAITAKGGIVNSGDGLEEYPNDISTIKNELTAININENGTYSNGIEDTISTNNYPIVINANGDNIKSIIIDGNSNQASTPTPTNPVDVNGVGERTGNLFDATTVVKGRISSSTGAIEYAEGVSNLTYSDTNNEFTITTRYAWIGFVTEYLDLQEKPAFSYISDDGRFYAFSYAYDENKNFLGEITSSIPTGTKYIRVSIQCSTAVTNAKIKNIMLNTGSEPLPFEPYGVKITISSAITTTNIYLGDVQTTRKIKKWVLTGTESISFYSNGASGVGFRIDISDMVLIDGGNGYCNHFSTVNSVYGLDDNAVQFGSNNTTLYFVFSVATVAELNLSNNQSVIDWVKSQYRGGTPVTVWYMLETPETGIVNEPLMKIGDYADRLTLTDSTTIIPTISGNNTIDYDLILKPSNTQITYNKININKTITSDTSPITINSDGSNATVSINGNTVQNGTPTPTNPIQPQSCGERTGNLLNYTTVGNTQTATVTQITNGISISGKYFVRFRTVKFIIGRSYTMVWTAKTISGKVTPMWRLHYSDNTYSSLALNGESLVADKEVSWLLLYVNASSTESGVAEFTDIMLNTGSTPLPYEPYGYKIPILNNSQTTNVYLGEVESTRQIKKLVLKGTESWVIYGGNYFSSVIDSDSRQYKLCYCTHLESTFSSGIYVDSGGSRLKVFSASVSSVATTLDEWKTYLQQQYANGTPVTVWYVLATPETGIVNEPLMKIGDYSDSLSTTITTIEGQNILNINTTIKPSLTSITYNELNTIGWKEINVNVPNTYTNEDNGKVVNNNTLIAQTAYPTEITENNTYDTTLYNSIVVNVPTGGSVGTKNDVNFYDYDGTVVTSYSAADFANLSELPANPTHEGLTAQGWNWSLSDAKTYVNKYGSLNIGQMYVTDDGKTRIYITLSEGRISPILQLYLNANSELDIDWGDGSTHSTFTITSAGYVSERHNYATAGDYVIAITVTTGSFILQSSSTNVSSLLWDGNNSSSSPDRAYTNSIQKIKIGTGVTSIGDYAFYLCYSLSSITISDGVTSMGNKALSDCYSLTSITVPDSVTSTGQYIFQNCFSLTSITIPDSVTSIGEYTFQNCYSLTSIIVPDSVTSIDGYAFQNCRSSASITIPDSVTSISGTAFQNCFSLTSITIPDSVTSIGEYTFYQCYSLTSIIVPDSVTSIDSYAFYKCYSLGYIKFTSTTPPTVVNSNAWTEVPTSCPMLVPINTFAAYTTATYYPSSSTYTYLVFGTYASSDTLPSTSTDNYNLTWYASIADAIAQTNPITTGNGNEIYARCIAI